MADGTIAYNMGGGYWKKTDPTNGTVFYVNQYTGESTRDEPDIPSSSDGEGDSDSGQASPADAAPVPPAARDEAEDEEQPHEEEAFDSDSDLTPIEGVAFTQAAGWVKTKLHAFYADRNDGSFSFTTVAEEIERVYEVKMSKTWRKRLKTL